MNDSLVLGSLGFVRAYLIGLLAATSTLVAAQATGGTYTAQGGKPQPWSVNSSHTLIWNGSPYLPVGMHIFGTPDEIAKAKAEGFSDVIVDLPAGGTGWSDAIKALETSGMRYLISINSLAPMAQGVEIEPGGYRVNGITKAQKMTVQLPGASSALAVVMNTRDSSVAEVKVVPVLDGVISLDVKPYAEMEEQLIIYPKTRSLEQPDLWDAMDEHRDRLLATLRNNPPGPGLRGIINPFGHMAAWTKTDPHFVPTSPYFRFEFAAFLKQKYKSVETAEKAWSMSVSGIDTFEGLAKLAPLWAGAKRGVPDLWDTDTDKLYDCNPAKSLAWRDIADAIADTAARRYDHFTTAMHAAVDVPLVQDWAGWMPIYESARPTVDGIGLRATGTSPSALLDSSSRATSSILRWQKSGWLVATEIDPGAAKDAGDQISNVVDDLISLGSRGWFIRSNSPAVVKAMAGEMAKSQDLSLAQSGPTALFYPENAFNPATPQRLPGGRWWLPSPANGNRVDLGSHFFAYRYQGADSSQSFTAIWTDLPEARVKLHMLGGKTATFTSVDGRFLDPKVSKDTVTVTIGSSPILIGGTEEIPIPEPSYAALARMDQLFSIADDRLIDLTEPRYLFKDALAGFDRNPGGSFVQMKLQFDRVSLRMAPFTWIEAETCRNHNFSEVDPSAGCSNGGMLTLRTQIPSSGEGYTAEYSVPVRTGSDVEVWMAARIPADQRASVSVVVAGETFTITSDPISPYGQGFAWYKLGVTKLGGAQTKMKISVNSPSVDMAFDAFAFVPGHFDPKGVALPDAINFAIVKKKK